MSKPARELQAQLELQRANMRGVDIGDGLARVGRSRGATAVQTLFVEVIGNAKKARR